MAPRGSPAGIVFRRLDGDLERRQAARLLPACGLEDHDSTCVWYGLCDLTATTTNGLAGVAVVRSVQPTTARLCGLAVSGADRGDHLGRRLVCEVADRLRASGVEEIVAPPALEERLPAIDETWGDFGVDTATELEARTTLPKVNLNTFHVGRVRDFRSFVSAIEADRGAAPTLHMLHTLPLPPEPHGAFTAARNLSATSIPSPNVSACSQNGSQTVKRATRSRGYVQARPALTSTWTTCGPISTIT